MHLLFSSNAWVELKFGDEINMSNGMLSQEEVAQYLDIDAEGVVQFIKEKKLNAYKIGGTYLRFRKEQVVSLKSRLIVSSNKNIDPLTGLQEFWNFNNFYIIAGLGLIGLMFFTLR